MKITNPRDIPSSVYRLQLSSEFPLKKVIQILPYLKELGVDGVYCSPFYDAYTSHGYDVTNPNAFNLQLGTLEEFDAFFTELKKLDLKLIIDVIPNHMGIKAGKNTWWQDILENGPYSEYATFFDINWSTEKKEMQDRVLLPILGDSYGKVLEKQEIKLFFSEGRFFLQYTDFPLPVRPHSYAVLLEFESDRLKKSLGETSSYWKEYQELKELYRFFPVATKERLQKSEEGRERLANLAKKSKAVHTHIKHIISKYNGKKKSPASFDLLDKLLEAQFYRLAYWKVASHEINYRRFFNIHELVAIRIEDELVLNLHHKLIYELMDSGKIQGLRIDHPDGLYDPVHYFERLRKKLPLYTVVEKILDRKEELSDLWQVEGTVGYEYLNLLNGLFIDHRHEKQFTNTYEEFIGKKVSYEEIVYQAKKKIATHEMVSELEALGLKLDRLSEHDRDFRDFTRHDLTQALSEVIACFPVYRTYIGPTGKPSKRDKKYITEAIAMAKRQSTPQLDDSIFDFLEKVLLLKLNVSDEKKASYREFVLRFQQLTGPMMAKGLEDTAFYIYNRFIAMNEVGGDPRHFGHTLSDFHKFNQEKKEKWPFGFLASSTHDTKRNEDVRMRLNVLSEIPAKWKEAVKGWSQVTHKMLGPTPNAEYFIYQTLIGVWPNEPLTKEEIGPFVERVWQVVLKCLREAKEETGWLVPNQVYETAVRNFIFSILSFEEDNAFLKHFLPFQKEIARFGAWNSVSATILKIASCGVADIYQGNETLIYQLVDPDNRTTVDFERREKLLKNLKKETPESILNSFDFEKIKLYLHWKTLQFRKTNKSLFLMGDYIPLEVRGAKKNHLIAFVRKYENQILIVLAGRFFVSLLNEKEKPTETVWKDTHIILPEDTASKSLNDIFSGKEIKNNSPTISVADIFGSLPIAYLYGSTS